MGIKYLTVYAFSTENWKRSKDEVDALMTLLRNYMKTCVKTAKKNHMKVRVIGDKTGLAQDIQDSIAKLEEESKDQDGLNFTIAINYGSRDEIRRAVTKIVEEGIRPEDITEETISDHLDTAGIPGSGSSDPYQRRAASFQLPYVAAGVYGILFYRCAVA